MALPKLRTCISISLDKGWLHGIEVVNDLTYSDEALQIALDYNLAIMGTSDIHGLVDWQYEVPEGGHRPVTLVYSSERSAEGIKEGLENRRTVVWFRNTLIGRERELLPLLKACIVPEKVVYQGISSVVDVYLENKSDAEFILVNKSAFSLHNNSDIVMVHPNSRAKIAVKTLKQLESFDLKFEVLNVVTAPNTHPTITIPVNVGD